jgi:hypothetical protein
MPVLIRRFLNCVRGGGAQLFREDASRRNGVAKEADRLIASFRDQAYYEARDRARGRCIDGAGSARYWTKVKLEVARRQSIAIGLAGADMRA